PELYDRNAAGRATLEVGCDARLLRRRFYVDRCRLPGRSRVAVPWVSLRRTRHHRPPQGLLLSVPKPMDESTSAASLTALELERTHWPDDSSAGVYQLQQR